MIDLYRLVAAPRGLEPSELPPAERHALAQSVVADFWPGFEVTEGSDRFDPIHLAEPDPSWPGRFSEWRARLAPALGPVALRIEHIASTSVPGLPAKPIVDIQISVEELADEPRYGPRIEALRVQLRSRDELHRFFRPFAGRPREVHIHVCARESTWERDHLLFRDYLRASPGARARYLAAKREAERLWSDDGWAYTDAKSDVILDLKEEAERWAAALGWTVRQAGARTSPSGTSS